MILHFEIFRMTTTDCAIEFPRAADIEGDCNVRLKLSVCFKTFEANGQQRKKEIVCI